MFCVNCRRETEVSDLLQSGDGTIWCRDCWDSEETEVHHDDVVVVRDPAPEIDTVDLW